MLAQYDPNMIWRDERRKKSQAWMRFPVLGLKRRAPIVGIEVASVIELSEASGRVAAGLFMTEG